MLLGKLDKYDVYLAALKDADEITNLLKSAASWLKENQIDQWGFLLSGGEDAEIKEAIMTEKTFIVKDQDQIIGTFTLYLSQNEWDKDIWGVQEDNAVYLHRLATDRSLKGNGLGKAMINWTKEYLKEQNVSILRLDCVGFNQKLNQFYLDCGLEKVGTSHDHSKYQAVLS